MTRTQSSARIAALMLSTAALVVAPGALAQDAAAQDQASGAEAVQNGGIADTIVVTANKRSESLQKVAISVSAFSGEQIDRLGITETTRHQHRHR